MTSPEQMLSLVTGASRGIGAALAQALATRGDHVVLTARTEAGLIETDDAIHAAGGQATIAPLDLTDFDGIDRLATAVAARWPKLDRLVINAATLGTLTPLAHADPKEFERVFALNVTASFRLIRAFDPLLRRAAPAGGHAQLVMVSSSVATRAAPYWGAYAASKAALENMAGVYAEEMKALGVHVLLVDPGGTRTSMRARAYPGEDPATLKTPETVATAILDRLTPGLPPGLSRLALQTRPG
ncbi:SDR family NAD(P)-dependent oxidoreductase [Sandaracinobacteroides saxicola]|uniref:SDR family NAD(P)-dependent oxidoreductase n=1 Tax=Sandaracinobacteroides saxicola TaxID=2759707 RepID=A0A7G5ILT8_9SPHN|nr:SDR family NAD(P)-dependent oxidoreductase [Sandaracinobacteroides saxicola]QMW24330.1 SDR family NAD(P)-dependent oxidoreductase [Sandaracinobacteroides saxicola]